MGHWLSDSFKEIWTSFASFNCFFYLKQRKSFGERNKQTKDDAKCTVLDFHSVCLSLSTFKCFVPFCAYLSVLFKKVASLSLYIS